MFARFDLRKSTMVASGITACLVGAAPAALAQEKPVIVYAQPENTRTERVSYRDLDLAARAGERTLEQRVSGAVRRVCDYNGGSFDAVDRGYILCARGAWQGAQPQIDRAVARAHEIALNGSSSIAATAITISAR